MGIDFRAAIINGRKVMAVQPVTLADSEEGADLPPFLTLGMDLAQSLMDELWNCGLRPSEGTGSAGAMAAVQAHLADMRALVFTPIGGKLPPLT
jgi:hypothetical protein